MPEKVYLTIGRHGSYDYGSRFPILESSILDSVYRGMQLTADYGKPDVIYSSKITRAAATANLRAIGADYPRHKIKFDDALSENADKGSISLFFEALTAEAQVYHMHHIHLVTHAPIIEKILSLLTKEMCFMQAGGCLVLSADNWEKISCQKGSLAVLADFYPGFAFLSDLWQAHPQPELIKKYFSGNPKVSINWIEVMPLILKSSQLSICQTIDDVYSLFEQTDNS